MNHARIHVMHKTTMRQANKRINLWTYEVEFDVWQHRNLFLIGHQNKQCQSHTITYRMKNVVVFGRLGGWLHASTKSMEIIQFVERISKHILQLRKNHSVASRTGKVTSIMRVKPIIGHANQYNNHRQSIHPIAVITLANIRTYAQNKGMRLMLCCMVLREQCCSMTPFVLTRTKHTAATARL